MVVVTGGARGVTAEALFPLVRAGRPKLALLGRTAIQGQEPEWLAPLTDEAKIKQAIVAHCEKPLTPREVGEEYRRVLARREVRANLGRLRDAGATIEYLAVNVEDAAATAAALASVRHRLGPITALIHGAGVLADRRIDDLTDEQFESVYNTKVIGLNNLLAATRDDPLKAIVLFSSSTGRFGRTGQAAYAAANEVLNKTAQSISRTRPHCRTVAFNWGPWEGGMVTPARARLRAGGNRPDLVHCWRRDAPARAGVRQPARRGRHPGAAAAATEVTAAPEPTVPDLTLVLERKVALTDHPVLRSHVIGDKAVVPFVLHVEWMAHAAMHGNPGLKFHGFDDLRIFQGIHVEEATPAVLRVLSGKATRRDGMFVVPVEIRGTRKGRDVTHSRAQIVLTDRLPDVAVRSRPAGDRAVYQFARRGIRRHSVPRPGPSGIRTN